MVMKTDRGIFPSLRAARNTFGLRQSGPLSDSRLHKGQVSHSSDNPLISEIIVFILKSIVYKKDSDYIEKNVL